MATVSAPLNAEPALPEDRAKQHLALKSYANAVEEEPPVEASSGVNGTNRTNGTNNQVGDDDGKGRHKASVLKIVDTSVPPAEEKKEEKGEKADERPPYQRQESKQEYSATVCCLRSMFMLPIYF